ncbi:uncharacterized protein K452DRAFT_323110 [Aplosporella prunicola CBS 121167]|uniref:NAD-dependent epimerase/dehydratase domain-containing protein n=1 Tax=Aplosporella prunicola CBS 121167 TaxID=1176127 RepID=A0A6A6AWJ1_9PEZI|nr:uncharacterized protein K452DRAFT_323110 [Aplosporella prunicola CBS 121167]KAF2135345.1 hypothetical protein K452DRAFT_323110 [Aplosporella prunicola CBS 121167]
MSQNILITGASGYLGGTLLSRWNEARLDGYDKLFALYGAVPLNFSLDDQDAITEAITKHRINIVCFMVDVVSSDAQLRFIKALATLKQETHQEVHLLHTSGAKLFSARAGAPTDREISDADPNLYDIQKQQTPENALTQKAVNTNNTIVEQDEASGVRTYIFVPCLVYGKGEGFGNQISIQTVAAVKAAKATGQVYKISKGRPVWPVCHVLDNNTLYVSLLRAILNNENPDHGRHGYYLAASGSIVVDDLYVAMAAALAKRGIVKTDTVEYADDAALEKIGRALGCDPAHVEVHLGGLCTLTAARGARLGWKPQFSKEHAFEAADEEVDWILRCLE